MKSLGYITSLTLGLAISGFGIADDVGPDKAIELVEQGAIKHFRELNKIAQALHPQAQIVDTELESHYGKYVYALELRGADNVEWDVHLDAVTGDVLENRQDQGD